MAIILSALVHLGFADRAMVRAPGHALPSPAMLSVRLEIPVTPRPAPPPPQDDAKGVRQHVPDAQSRTRLDRDSVRKTSKPQSSFPPTSAEEMPDTHTLASALLPAPDPVYYPARQLDVYPALIRPVSLEYANDSGGGRVLLMLLIDETGNVRDLSIIESGPARGWEDTLRATFAEARFSPARKDGRAVKSQVQISVDYRP